MQLSIKADTDQIQLAPVSDLKPIGYLRSTDLRTWTRVPGTIDVEDGILSIPFPTNRALSFKMEVPNFANRNVHLRVYPGAKLAEPQFLIIGMHGTTTVTNPGNLVEDLTGPYLDDEGILSCFPAAAPGPTPRLWNGENSPQASDYAFLKSLIIAAKAAIPSIKWVQLMTYSQSAQTGLGFVLEYPELVQSYVSFVGTDNPTVAAYVRARDGETLRSPVKCVFISTRGDPWYLGATNAAARMARLQGFTGQPEQLPNRLDINEQPAGLDSVVYKYGPNVEFLLSSAPGHDPAQFVSDPGWYRIYVNLPRTGLMPSESSDSPLPPR